jgi:UDP-N-acetylmuramoylalanine--D-glutamate ligase
MKIAILGYAGQGKSAYDYWNKKGNELVICDQSPEIEVPKGVTAKLGRDYLRNLGEFDLIVRTPSIHPSKIVEENGPEILEKVTTNTNEFFKVSPTKNIIGVTGTKGKGTTSTLITKMLEKAGFTVHLGGNIGTPPLDLLAKKIKKDDWVVLELANFQLIDLKHSPHIGVCLMVEPEHMDWHEDVDEYIAAKQQMFINQEKTDIAVYYAKNDNSLAVADASEGQLIPFMQVPGAVIEKDIIKIDEVEICPVAMLKLLGQHNWQNACAAVTAVWQITQDVKAISSALTSFSGLPFRIELRGEVKGVRYYNDSFASAPGASIAAMHAIPGKKVMIIGGFDRMLELGDFVKELKAMKDIRKVVVIGQAGKRLIQEFESAKFTNFADMTLLSTMSEIVKFASAQAQKGDAVILSPGFASFDMFQNFEDRGKQFNAAVKKL